jgi:hypothetical protein
MDKQVAPAPLLVGRLPKHCIQHVLDFLAGPPQIKFVGFTELVFDFGPSFDVCQLTQLRPSLTKATSPRANDRSSRNHLDITLISYLLGHVMRRAMDCYEEVLNLFVKDALRKSFPSLMEQQQQKLAGLRLELENAEAGNARDKTGNELKNMKLEVRALSNEITNEINRMEQQQKRLAGLRTKEQEKLLELENAGAGTARDKIGNELKTIKSEVRALSNEKKEEMEERWVLECRLESWK